MIIDRRMSLQARGRRPSMFDPIDPKELQQALYASAAAVSLILHCTGISLMHSFAERQSLCKYHE